MKRSALALLTGCALASTWAAAAAAQPPTVAPWRLSQDPSHPWKGTPRADIADHRNGASVDGRAVFSDPRWAARAVAIELRDYHRGGARSAADYAQRLMDSCSRFGGLDCGAPGLASTLAAAFGARESDELGLFGGSDLPTARLPQALRALAVAMTGATPDPTLVEVAAATVADDDLDQGEGGFQRWSARDPARANAVRAFEAMLTQAGVSGVVPIWQLLRTGSDWRGCGAPFEVPPPELQPDIVPTLAVVRGRIAPALGPLEAKSAYRGPWLNVCAGGAEKSAHREFSAVDLTPLTPTTRAELKARLCPIYASSGEADRLGLGFYAGVRFHIDTQRHRSWATENGRAFAPCAADGSVNPPLPPLPVVNPLPPAPPSR
ncbi:hypothetical protein BH09PSE2_BH09PSE2_22310 [soil metagenome]